MEFIPADSEGGVAASDQAIARAIEELRNLKHEDDWFFMARIDGRVTHMGRYSTPGLLRDFQIAVYGVAEAEDKLYYEEPDEDEA